MSIRMRATWGAIILCGGLLMVVGGSVSKSTALLKHERDVQRGKTGAPPPDPTASNVVMILGWLAAAGGGVMVGWAIRDMTRQIGTIQSDAEMRMRMEVAQKQEQPRPKS